jgi:hypothetical protein
VWCRSEVFERLWIAAVVVDDQQLVVAVGRKPLDALQATSEEGDVVPGRDKDAHLWVAFDLQPDPEATWEKAFVHGAFEASSLQRLGESPARPVSYGALVVTGGRGEIRPAVVQNLRDMVDLIGSLRCSQNQIVVLATVEAIPEPTYLFDQVPSAYAQMRYVVGG